MKDDGKDSETNCYQPGSEPESRHSCSGTGTSRRKRRWLLLLLLVFASLVTWVFLPGKDAHIMRVLFPSESKMNNEDLSSLCTASGADKQEILKKRGKGNLSHVLLLMDVDTLDKLNKNYEFSFPSHRISTPVPMGIVRRVWVHLKSLTSASEHPDGTEPAFYFLLNGVSMRQKSVQLVTFEETADVIRGWLKFHTSFDAKGTVLFEIKKMEDTFVTQRLGIPRRGSLSWDGAYLLYDRDQQENAGISTP